MLTDIGHVALRVADFNAYRTLFGTELGLTELACGTGSEGRRVCMFAVGPSVLELHEDPTADHHAAEEHFAVLVGDIGATYELLAGRGIPFGGAPSVQPLDHAYMQRSLLEVHVADGFRLQISEVVDPRVRWTSRRGTKETYVQAGAGSGPFAAFDHFNFGCLGFHATREFYGLGLGLAEISHRVEVEGVAVEEAGYAVGCTELEIWARGDLGALPARMVTRLGFWADEVDYAYELLQTKGIKVDGPPADWELLPGMRRRAFTLRDPAGKTIQIAQRPA
jgi:hypothetical protein